MSHRSSPASDRHQPLSRIDQRGWSLHIKRAAAAMVSILASGSRAAAGWTRLWTRVDAFAAANDELLFCELERRRVLSVNATFLSGILSIDIQPGLDPSVDSAVLLTGPDDATFLVDTNGNGQQDGSELTGQIADLRRVVVDGENGYGKFAWYGDFQAADLQDSALASINIRGLEDVTMGAKINTDGFVTIRNIDGMVTLGGEGSYAGESYVGELSIAESLNVVSNTGIRQGSNASLIVGVNARFESRGEIALATQPGDYLSIAGDANFISGDTTDRQSITVGALGAESGTGPFIDLARISAVGSDVRVFESNSLELDQIDVASLRIFAGETISDHTLANVSVAEHSLFNARSIILDSGEFNTGTLQFQSTQDTLISEASETTLLGPSNAVNLTLSSTGSLRDADAVTLEVAGDATFRSQTGTILADSDLNRLTVNGTASFFSPLDIQVGDSENRGANFGQLGLSGRNVTVYEGSSTELRFIVAERLDLLSGGAITDVAGASIDVRQDANIESLGSITLADAGLAGDQLRVGGLASFLAVANRTPSADLQLDDVEIGDGSSSSNLRALVELGRVDVVGRHVRLVESDATFLQRVIATTAVDSGMGILSPGERLEIVSGGSVQNIPLDGGASAVGQVYANSADIDAADWLLLESSELNTLNYAVGENLVTTQTEAGYLRSLRNSEAVATSVNVFNEINSAFTRKDPASQSLNPDRPATLDELRDRFDYEATHQGRYAAQVRNLGTLELSGGVARGDGLNVYVETVSSAGDDRADLIISGPVFFFDGSTVATDFSGLVLVAGAELSMDAGGSLVSTSFEVYDPALNAFAFQGGEGLGGNFSTSRVLPAGASQLDPFTQHFQQQVAASFGNTSELGIERGFQHIVAYADGNYQFFTVDDASRSNQAELLIRETVFDINFLTAWGSEQLPTSVVFRRAEGLFLYDSAGESDLAAASFSATASSDFVNDVFVGTVDPPLPPIVEPAPPPELPFVAPMLMLPEAPRTTIEIGSSDEVRPTTDNVVEIYIVAMYWQDLDVAPENDRLEVEEFEQMEVEAGERDAEEFLAQRKREIVQLPADRRLPTNATDEQIEAIVEDIQKNTLEYLDEERRPLFTEPVYGIIQSDPQRGESLWRLFLLRPESTESTDFEADEAVRRSQSSAIIGVDGNRRGDVEPGIDSRPDDSEADNEVRVDDRGDRAGAAVPVAVDRAANAAVLPAALWAAVDHYNVDFDRASRARRRCHRPASATGRPAKNLTENRQPPWR